jgi:hypothetical protein
MASSIKYLNERDTASFINLSTKTLQRLRLKGNGPRYIKCGARVLYDVDDLTAWLDGQKVQSTSAYAGA